MIFRVVFALLFALLSGLTILRAFDPGRLSTAPAVLTPARLQVTSLIDDTVAQTDTVAATDQIETRVRRLARSHPLDPTPYSLEVIGDHNDGDLRGANQAALMALTMQPRNRTARMHVINELVRTGQYSTAIEQITILSRIDRSGRETYENAIVRLAMDPATWPALEAAVKGDPPWKQAVVIKLVEADGSIDLLRRLFAAWPERLDLLLKRLIDEGNYDAAYLMFVNALPPSAALETPFDRDFERDDGVEPFTWVLNSRYAERDAAGGVSVVYFGRGRARLLHQVFPVVPGSYDLSYVMDGEFPEDAARFEWRMTCLPSREERGRSEVDTASVSLEEPVVPFEIPTEACSYLDLSLHALPGRFPQTTRFQIDRVRVMPTGQQG